MNSYAFDTNSHMRFTRLSSDYNPIHTDPVLARRMQPGAPIVHGIHALLRLLEEYSEAKAPPSGFKRLNVRFLKPIYIGEKGEFDFSERSDDATQARILVGGTEALVVHLDRGHRPAKLTPDWSTVPETPLELPTLPLNPDLNSAAGFSGCLQFGSIVPQTERMFPSAARHFGVYRLAALVRAGTLVGMLVPGLHSLFTGLKVSFGSDAGPSEDRLQFIVTAVERRFRLINVGIRGGGLGGCLETVSRPPPVTQATMKMITSLISCGEFRGQTALVVGGSRGLGELTAKLIAAGSGRVIITYASGRTDADAVCKEITSAGGDCHALAYDVHQRAREQLASQVTQAPSHVYYFATPTIFGRRRGIFDLDRFAEFNSFYISGFVDLMLWRTSLRPAGVTAFYPSSIALETRSPDMMEYAMSKSAGEILCADIQQNLPGVRIVSRRLPRILTDQTNSIVKTDSSDPVEVLLPILREMHS